MTNYLIRRFFQMILVVFLSTIAIYILLNIAPGGPLSGLRLSADRKSRVSDADIARLKAYLGLDKPLVLRYIVWLVGDDWLGADWMYLGLTQYDQPKIGRTGEQVFKVDRDTGEKRLVYEEFRFWTDPGVALFDPGYLLWVWGEQVEPDVFQADKIQVKPPLTEKTPGDVAVAGTVVSQDGLKVVIEIPGGRKYTILTDKGTEFTFPAGEGRPRPEEGRWLNISWLTGAYGLLSKYAHYHGGTQGLLRFDFGFSWALSPSQPVSDLIKSRLNNTIILMTTAAVLSLVVAIPIGIYSAVHQYSKVDYAVTTFAFFGSAMPVFWFGLMMILLFTYQFKQWGLPFMPSGGVAMVRQAPDGSLLGLMGAEPGSFVDRVVHIVMPAMVLSLLYMAGWSRFMRSSMLEVLRQDYVRTARAKGLTERVVIVKHALRNALIPIVTIVVFQIPGIFGGATLTETIFSYPGIGRLYYDALVANDWPVVMVLLFITAILVVIATLLGDILYTVVDPRIRFD
ncbi:MAG: ABC transporter permease [Chloroflexota bacterium]